MVPWQLPPGGVVVGCSAVGRNIARHGDDHVLGTAVGGTWGPPTGNMVSAARSRSIHGPWEKCPHNPLVHTKSSAETWWSRGHATLVEGPAGDWWSVYHGYESRSEEHTSELQSLMRISYAVFCLKKKK